MKSKGVLKLSLAAAVASAMGFAGSNARADFASDIFSQPSGTLVTYDGSPASPFPPIVTAILSQPGTFGGHTYTSWSILAQDSTGSLDIFSSSASFGSYVPTVGDAINVSGTYSPFHQIAEVGTVTSISLLAHNASAPVGPAKYTIPQLNVTTIPQNISGQLIELDNVTITPAGSGNLASGLFPTFSQATTATETYNVSDGVNTMTLFDWVTSYTDAEQLGGTAVPTGPVDLIGFDSAFTSGSNTTPEFTPIAIIPVPEPGTLALSGLAGMSMLFLRRRQA